MRQAYLYIIGLWAFAFAFSAKAQETAITEYRQNKVKVIRNSGNNAVSYYDISGRILMTIEPRDQTRIDTIFYTYDQNGNNTRIVKRHFVGTGNTQREFIQNYFYNSLNRIIESRRFTDKVIDDRELYFYNSCGNLDSVQTFYNYYASTDDDAQDSMTFNGTKHYFYNAAGQLIKKTYQHSTWIYEYNNAGQLLREISSSMYRPCRGESYMLTETANYRYKEGKLIAVDFEYSTSDNQIMPKHQAKYEFLNNGLKSKEVKTTWIYYKGQEQEYDKSITEFYYDYNEEHHAS